MVFEATVYLRREYLAVLAAVDMRLTGYFFLWVIDVERVLVGRASFEVGWFQGFLHFQCHPYPGMASLQSASVLAGSGLSLPVAAACILRTFAHRTPWP